MAIVKILSRHSPSYESLIRYILKEGKQEQVFAHNLRSHTVSGWTKEFRQNESFRKHSRADQVFLYHDILSFSAKEQKAHLTKDMLSDIARKYMELRGYDGQYLGAVHRDKEHVHIHFCTSGLAYRTGAAFRLSREKLQDLKQELQRYHLEKYPELKHSTCGHGKGKQYTNDRKYRVEQRAQGKAYIEGHLKECLAMSKSRQELLDLLMHRHDIFHYERKGHIEGLIYNGTKFRLTRLGVEDQFRGLPVEEPKTVLKHSIAMEKNHEEVPNREIQKGTESVEKMTLREFMETFGNTPDAFVRNEAEKDTIKIIGVEPNGTEHLLHSMPAGSEEVLSILKLLEVQDKEKYDQEKNVQETSTIGKSITNLEERHEKDHQQSEPDRYPGDFCLNDEGYIDRDIPTEEEILMDELQSLRDSNDDRNREEHEIDEEMEQ